MGKIGKFVRLSSEERFLLVCAALLLMGVRLDLAIVSFRSVEHGLRRFMEGTASATNERVPRERLAWAVQVVSRYIPGARCLTQAIVLKALLRRHGYPASLRMGFGKDGGDKFEGHAWVESQGQILLGGGPSLSRFSR